VEDCGWVHGPATIVTKPGEQPPEVSDPTFRTVMPNVWSIPKDLNDFLESGEAPVCIF
jgi:hypothetical protein